MTSPRCSVPGCNSTKFTTIGAGDNGNSAAGINPSPAPTLIACDNGHVIGVDNSASIHAVNATLLQVLEAIKHLGSLLAKP